MKIKEVAHPSGHSRVFNVSGSVCTKMNRTGSVRWTRTLKMYLIRSTTRRFATARVYAGFCWMISNKTIGRVAAFVNEKTVNKGNDQSTGGMGFFEVINDQKAAFLLLGYRKALAAIERNGGDGWP